MQKGYQITITLICLCFTNVFLIIQHNPSSILSYLYSTILFCVFHFVAENRNRILENATILQLYFLLVIILYFLQLYIMPDWHGFSGMYGGVGTDDSRFYAPIADNIQSIPHRAIGYRRYVYNYSKFLEILYPFYINHPLDILLPNVVGIALIPHFVGKLYLLLFKDKKGSIFAFRLSIFCPIIAANGFILIRDGWTAFLFIAGMCSFIEKRYIWFFFYLLLLSYLRMASGFMLIVPVALFGWEYFTVKNKGQQLARALLVLVFFGFIFAKLPDIRSYFVTEGIDDVYRHSYVDSFVQKIDSSSTIAKISNLEWYLRMPIGFLFFLFMPYLKLQTHTQGLLNIRTILSTTVAPTLFFVYYYYIVNGFVCCFLRKVRVSIDAQKIFLTIFIVVFLVSQLSIQPRHKTVVMPLYYLMTAYGMRCGNNTSRLFSFLFVLLLFLVSVYQL